MAFERRASELSGVGSRDFEPESLRRVRVGSLVDLHAVDKAVVLGASSLEEPQEELDQRRVAVHEYDPVVPTVWLVLCSFTPVGNRPGDDDLAVTEWSDLG